MQTTWLALRPKLKAGGAQMLLQRGSMIHSGAWGGYFGLKKEPIQGHGLQLKRSRTKLFANGLPKWPRLPGWGAAGLAPMAAVSERSVASTQTAWHSALSLPPAEQPLESSQAAENTVVWQASELPPERSDEASSAPQRPQHKLMSYNAHNFYQAKQGRNMKSRPEVEALAEAILKENPDMIALQEVGNTQLLQEFNQQYLHGKYPNIVSSQYGSSIQVGLMSKASLPVVRYHWHNKGNTQEVAYARQRNLLEVHYQTASGYQFSVFNGHYKAMMGKEKETASIRLSEARNTAAILERRLEEMPNLHGVVMGDLNTLHDSRYGQPVIQTLTHLNGRRKLPVLTEVMLKDGKPMPTHHGGPRYKPCKLDYIFVTPAVLENVVAAYVAGDFKVKPWRLASDHLPCVTIIQEPRQMLSEQVSNASAASSRLSMVDETMPEPEPETEPTPSFHLMTTRGRKRKALDLIA